MTPIHYYFLYSISEIELIYMVHAYMIWRILAATALRAEALAAITGINHRALRADVLAATALRAGGAYDYRRATRGAISIS